ncbi:MAG TPA: hypothetical protein VG675_12775 [Bryobacteraceae bacterium]|nr:hypothetical protein [Bryobacteraceae bacterium]
MREILGEVHLDPEFLGDDTEFHTWTGYAYLASAEGLEDRRQFRERCVIAATNLRRAGAHLILLDDFREAQGLFKAAGRAYMAAGLPFSAVMMGLAGAERENTTLSPWLEHLAQAPHWFVKQLVYSLLVDTANQALPRESGQFEGAVRELRAIRGAMVGTYGLTVGDYLDLAASFDYENGSRVMEALIPFLTAYNNAMRRAMADAYHWEHLMMPFHPAEPDLVGPIFIAGHAMKVRERYLREQLRQFPLHFLTRGVLDGVLEFV